MKYLPVRFVLWFVTLALFPIPLSMYPQSFLVEVWAQESDADQPAVVYSPATAETTAIAVPAADRSLALDWSTQPKVSESAPLSLSARVLVYLEKAEKKEIDPWLRDDIRIAWITALWSERGIPSWSLHGYATPYVAATYQVLHCHPDQVFSAITARRKAMLGAEYADFFPEASSPKKPCVSVGLRRRKRVA